MKYLTTKYTRRRWQWRSRLICVPAALLFFVLSAQAQTDVILPPIGGTGGGQFVAPCPQGQLLTGFELRTGDDVDAIRPICVTAYGPADVGPLVPGVTSFGGNGGGPRQLLCPKDAPVVTGMFVRAEGVDTLSVNNIHLWCGVVAATQNLSELPNAVFDGPLQKHNGKDFIWEKDLMQVSDTQYCPAGLVAIGINGRSGALLDSVGLICGKPKLTPKPPKMGTVNRPGTGAPPRGICDRAREARARNSPVAANLETQCRAAIQRQLNEPGSARLPDEAGQKPPTKDAPTITADSNPVLVPNGKDSGTTTITWKTGPDYTYCEIYLSVDNGEWSEFARSPDDAKPAMIKLGSSYTFRMMVYEGPAGTPKIITALTVTAKH